MTVSKLQGENREYAHGVFTFLLLKRDHTRVTGISSYGRDALTKDVHDGTHVIFYAYRPFL